jgi:hypothetical protein
MRIRIDKLENAGFRNTKEGYKLKKGVFVALVTNDKVDAIITMYMVSKGKRTKIVSRVFTGFDMLNEICSNYFGGWLDFEHHMRYDEEGELIDKKNRRYHIKQPKSF